MMFSIIRVKEMFKIQFSSVITTFLIINIVLCNDITLPTIDGKTKSLNSILNENNKTNDKISDSKLTNNNHRIGCASPEVLVNGAPSPDIVGTVSGGNFATIEEIQFVGIIGPLEQKRVCKIKCLNGVWVGPLCALERGDQFAPMLRECHLRDTDAELVITHNNTQVFVDTRDGLTLPHGSRIQVRCDEIGLYKFQGNTSMHCVDGLWDAVMPHCEATTLHKNFSLDAPPSIVYTIVDGISGVDEEGRLVLIPGTIVHLDCLYQRDNGNPRWNWTNAQRQYTNGWAINTDSHAWKYRLSIYYSKPEDSGLFTCTAPDGKYNQIDVLVKDVECPLIDSFDANRVMSVEGNRMHDRARFSCVEGYYLYGTQEITCLSNGLWSDSPPKCKLIECPQLSADDDLYLRMSGQNRTYGSRLRFSCSIGYKLIGSEFITCLKNRTWSDDMPRCEAITCIPPMAPLNGRILDNSHYLAGDYIQFTCNSGFVIMGEPLAICMDNGTWSSPLPTCKAVCEFPGELANGHIEPTKFHYNIDETVTVVCNHNFRLLGTPKLKCNQNGHWSSPKPHCRPFYF